MSAVIVVPSLKISGGIREVLRLTSELNRDGHVATVLSLWSSPHAMDSNVSVTYLSSCPPRATRALGELPILARRFMCWWRHTEQHVNAVVFTHYATLPLALLVPSHQRFFFVQDLEWKFIGNGIISHLLRRFVLSVYRTGRIISANAYLSQRLVSEGMSVALEAPIWADASFISPDAPERNIEFAMVLRKGNHKRLDLYLRFIALARERHLRVAVITPEDEIVVQVRDQVNEVLLRPKHAQMRDLYARSTCFIHLSEHEGFGLPPLEAMGAGCIPVCRDSGGVRIFMQDGPCADLLLPLATPIEDVLARAEAVIRDPNKIHRHAAVRTHFERGLAHCERARDGILAAMLNERHQ